MKEIPIISKLSYFIVRQSELYRERLRQKRLLSYGLDPYKILQYVRIDNIQNVKIGPNTYMNSGRIQAGKNAKIIIGDWCAIGYNVNIIASTHDVNRPTGPNRVLGNGIKENDIVIGDNVWIGNNVYIREGITIGSNVIIGANSVVTKNVNDDDVVGGVPAKLLYNKKDKRKK